jgi:hypothetical protein
MPFHIPNNLAGIHQIVSRLYNDLAPGITVTQPSGGWFGTSIGSTAAGVTYNPARATPRRADVTTPGAPGSDIPSDGTSLTPTGSPGQVGQGGSVGQSSAPAEAQRDRILNQYSGPITAAAREFNLPPQLIAAISVGEGGQMIAGPQIRGTDERAFGLMQVRPSTYTEVARRLREARGIADPEANIRVGAAYFGQLLRQYNGDTALALAAYNWGPRNVDTLMRSAGSRAEAFARMPEETRQYLGRVGAAAGGWDSATERNTLPRLTGTVNGVPTPAAGAPTGNVPQVAPTSQDQEGVNTFINLTVQSAAMAITGATSFADRSTIKERLLASYPAAIRRQYPRYVDHIMLELRRQLARIT